MKAKNYDHTLLLVASNDLILEKIIENLNFAGLQSFRLVCSQWKKTSNKRWYKTACVHIGPHDGTQSLQNFLDFIAAETQNDNNFSTKYPFQKYSLKEWESQPGMEATCVKFMQLCGEYIKHLQLNKFRYCDIANDQDCLLQVVRCLSKNAPSVKFIQQTAEAHTPIKFLSQLYQKGPAYLNLTRLELHLFSGVDATFLIKFPNLKRLKVTAASVLNFFWQLFCSLYTLRHYKRKTTNDRLALIHLDAIDTYQEFRGLVEACLPLAHLTLSVREHQMLLLHKIINHYNKQLETLKLLRPPSSSYESFPEFPFGTSFGKLKELELWGNWTADFNFLKFTPALTRLKMDYFCFEKRHLFHECAPIPYKPPVEQDLVENSDLVLLETDNFVLPSMDQFVTDRKLSVTSWKILKRWMPNLRQIEAPLDNDSLRAVCRQWPNLRKLRLSFGSQVDDEGLIGSSSVKETITEKSNITNLKFLESLVMDVECKPGQLTDKSAELGFLKLEHLRHLRIYALDGNISPEIEMELKGKIENVEIRMLQKLETDSAATTGDLFVGLELETWDYYNWTMYKEYFS